jgi:hypothetical protein
MQYFEVIFFEREVSVHKLMNEERHVWLLKYNNVLSHKLPYHWSHV